MSVAMPSKPGTAPDRPAGGGPSLRHVIIGSALVAAGVAWLADAAGWVAVPWDATPALGLLAVGVALVAGARRRDHAGLIVLGIILTVVQTAIVAIDVPVRGGVGERTARPTELSALRSPYRLSVGTQTIDLTALSFPPGTTEVEASVAVGDIIVTVPRDVSVVVEGRLGVGDLIVFGDKQSLLDTRTTVRAEAPGSDRQILLRLSVGVGKIEVLR